MLNSLRLTELVNENVRTPDLDWTTDANGDPVANFSVPLTPTEQARYNDCVAMARTKATSDLTFAEYQAIKPFLASEQAWMAITRNAFVNMTDGDMRRAVYDIITAEVRLARAARRDG